MVTVSGCNGAWRSSPCQTAKAWLVEGWQMSTKPVVFLKFGLRSQVGHGIGRGRFGPCPGGYFFSWGWGTCGSNCLTAMRAWIRRVSFVLLSHLPSHDVALSKG